MTDKPRLLVFSDLDGTLVDHETYDWSPAVSAIAALMRCGAGIVLSSSKTPAEMVSLRTEMGLEAWPAIVENGAGLLPAGEASLPDTSVYRELRERLESVPMGLRAPFQGFGDMSIDDVTDVTGLSHAGAVLAKERCFSEPGLWSGNSSQKLNFLDALKYKGLTAQQGGRFLTLSFGANKADQVQKLIDVYKPQYTIALGDAPNDIQMLESVDFPVVITNPHRPSLPPLENESKARRTELAGPRGWNTAIHELIEELGL